MEFFKKFFEKKDQNPQGEEHNVQTEQSGQLEAQEQEEITTGTKVKVVAALLVVGFAAYVAYWIQEPVEIRADLLGSGSSTQSSTQASSQQAGTTQEVSIINFSFDPATLNPAKGTTVVWTNKDTVPHNVVGGAFVSPTLNPGESFSYTFNSEGSFAYQCTFHPQMKGYVIVGTPAQASKDQVLSGFGAGNSMGLPLTSTGSADQTMSQEAVSSAGQSQADSQALSPAETPVAPITPEPIYTSAAPAPELHGAGLQPLSASLSNVAGVAANADQSVENAAGSQGGTSMSAAEQQALDAAQANQAQVKGKGKLASSGPEDFVYAGIFGVILYLNRRKLGKFHKSLR